MFDDEDAANWKLIISSAAIRIRNKLIWQSGAQMQGFSPSRQLFYPTVVQMKEIIVWNITSLNITSR